MKKQKTRMKSETIDTVEREREREILFKRKEKNI